MISNYTSKILKAHMHHESETLRMTLYFACNTLDDTQTFANEQEHEKKEINEDSNDKFWGLPGSLTWLYAPIMILAHSLGQTKYTDN